MMLQNQPELQMIYNDTRLIDLFQILDQLHTAASEDQLHLVMPLTEGELLGWLQDLVFTAQETIVEIQQLRARHEPMPRLIVIEGGREAS